MTDTKMTKETLTKSLTALTEEEKQFAFVAGLYVAVMLQNPKGLYFGGLRTFVCEVFPAVAKDGNFGQWSPMLGKVCGTLIEKGFIGVEERKAKQSKGNAPKFHTVLDSERCSKTLQGLSNKFGAKFSTFVYSAALLYQDENAGGGSDWDNMSNDFCNFYE